MRILELGVGLLFAACALTGCTSTTDAPGDDAGSFPDEGPLQDDDAGAPVLEADASDGSRTRDDGGDLLDAGQDATVPPSAQDAGGDASTRDASARDAGLVDGSSPAADASDAATGVVDASGDSPLGLDASDGAANPFDATVGAVDASPDAAAAGEAGIGSNDASNDSATGDDSSTDAADAAPACVSCGVSLSFLGNTAAFVTGGASVALQGGTVPDGATVSIITQTYPQGAVLPGNAHVLFATDAAFTTQVDALMTFDKQVGNNDQWYVVLPAQAAATTVYWYVRADGCDCSTVDYDNPGPFQNFTYTEE